MLFNSAQFLVFFPTVCALYFALPHRYRWLWLLLASCYFYMAFIPAYILILLCVIAVDFTAGLLIERSQGRRRTVWLVISLISNIGMLGIFKYFNFVNGNLASLAALLDWNYPIQGLEIILPIGLSFHTFQSMSYTIEVYRGRQPAERHLGIFALYVMFFPQLVAGPIERPQNLLPQLHAPHAFDYPRVTAGLKLMAWGLFKKVVIADRLALLVDQVYNAPTHYEGPSLVAATVCFAYQIYCDFSGYSDIAIGAAQVLGIDLMQNFNRPYAAGSVADFWRRWHISLSSWFRDYVYIPLGGNRVGLWRWQLNLLVTFLLSGLWHGANWTFVLWGALHGSFLVAANLTAGFRAAALARLGAQRFPRLLRAAQLLGTFTLVCFAWIFFRAASLSDAWYVVSHLFSGYGALLDPAALAEMIDSWGLSPKDLLVAACAVAVLEGVQWLQAHPVAAPRPAWVRWSVYYALIFAILIFGVFAQSKFIYFQF